jgi:hypothetical protein
MNPMKKGSFKLPAVPISQLVMNNPPLFHFCPVIWYGATGCGPTALALVTGVDPFLIKRLNEAFNKKTGIKEGTSSEFMIWFLKKHNWQAYNLTLRDLSPNPKKIENQLTEQHLFIASQHACAKEQTWFVYWGGTNYHQFLPKKMDVFDTLNNPQDEIILLYNKKYKREEGLRITYEDFILDADRDRNILKQIKGANKHCNNPILQQLGYYDGCPDIESATDVL